MECWTQNNWRTPQHAKSKGWNKQRDDFQATFPNFMTLTNEERHEFFQTLYAAKVKLENKGVTVKPFFGTVHDQSWNSEASDLQDDGYISQVSKTPIQYQNNFSSASLGPISSVSSIRSGSSEKILKEDELFGEFSQENLEDILGRNESSESLGFDENEVEVTNCNEIFKSMMKIPKSNPIISSLSYEILNKGNDASNFQQQKEDTLKIKGTKLKVQVTLTSGDNEKMNTVLYTQKKPQTNDLVSGGFTRDKILRAENEKKTCDEDVKSEEGIDDPEIKDLLNVEKDSVEELLEEEEKPLFKIIRKKSSEGKKKENRSENDSDKAEGGKIKVEDHLLLKKESDKGEALQERSKTKILIGKEKPEKERNDKEIVKKNSNVSTPSSFELKGNTKSVQQLAMTTVKEGTGSGTKLKKQEAEVANRTKMQMERKKRVEKLRKCLQKKELAYQKIMKTKSELETQGNEKSNEFKKENTSQEEETIEKNPISTNLEHEEEAPSISEEKNMVAACIDETKEEKKIAEAEVVARSDSAAQIGDGVGVVGGPDPAQIGDAVGEIICSDPAPIGDAIGEITCSDLAPIGDAVGEITCSDPAEISDAAEAIENSRAEEVSESGKDNLECAAPLKAGKVVFVDDNAIEKIRNVILDLDKHARSEDRGENEYLVLLVDYVEYLTSVTATLFEERVKNQSVEKPKFDEENLEEIEKVLRAPTPTSEDELESNEELKMKKKRKKNKPKKGSFIKCLKKCFRCGKSKNKIKARSSSSRSSR